MVKHQAEAGEDSHRIHASDGRGQENMVNEVWISLPQRDRKNATIYSNKIIPGWWRLEFKGEFIHEGNAVDVSQDWFV